MSRAQELLKKMKSGEMVIGTHANLFDFSVSEQLSVVGFEYVWIDGEHAPLDKQSIMGHIIACQAGGAAAFVRIPWNDPVLVKPILEMGPDGIVFPFIRNAEEARLAVSSCLYPPKGIRGFGPRRANRYGTQPNDEYLQEAETSFLKIIQIEHIDAVNNLDEILAVGGIDTICVGPNDLSGSLGLLGQTRHPEVMEKLDIIAQKCRAAGKPFGVSMGLNVDNVEDWIRRGVSWMGVGSDVSYITDMALETIRVVKEIQSRNL